MAKLLVSSDKEWGHGKRSLWEDAVEFPHCPIEQSSLWGQWQNLSWNTICGSKRTYVSPLPPKLLWTPSGMWMSATEAELPKVLGVVPSEICMCSPERFAPFLCPQILWRLLGKKQHLRKKELLSFLIIQCFKNKLSISLISAKGKWNSAKTRCRVLL